MKHKIRMVVEVEIEDRDDTLVDQFIEEGTGRDLVNGGPFVVTGLGTEDCGIVSAKVTSLKKRKCDVNPTAVEAAEIIACNSFVQGQVDMICPQDRKLLGDNGLRTFFTIGYWRNKYLDLLLDSE